MWEIINYSIIISVNSLKHKLNVNIFWKLYKRAIHKTNRISLTLCDPSCTKCTMLYTFRKKAFRQLSLVFHGRFIAMVIRNLIFVHFTNITKDLIFSKIKLINFCGYSDVSPQKTFLPRTFLPRTFLPKRHFSPIFSLSETFLPKRHFSP